MKTIKASALLTFLALAPLAVKAEQLRFTGQTRADVPLIKDVLRNVQLIAKARMSCEVIESVETLVLPDDFSPEGTRPEGDAKAQYERWLVSLCGHKESFLVTTWRQTNTPGVMFRVGFPFPSPKASQ